MKADPFGVVGGDAEQLVERHFDEREDRTESGRELGRPWAGRFGTHRNGTGTDTEVRSLSVGSLTYPLTCFTPVHMPKKYLLDDLNQPLYVTLRGDSYVSDHAELSRNTHGVPRYLLPRAPFIGP